jgi:NADPH-dependent 2,4-dienoyl-CoA reductase/sulfur reductase-like enzyme
MSSLPTSTTRCELLIIGAGPAGLAGAIEAARLGINTLVLDGQPAAGGQIYRAIGGTPVRDRAILGDDYWHGERLLQPFAQSGAGYCPDASVWAVSALGVAQASSPTTGAPESPGPVESEAMPGYTVAYSVNGESRLLHTRHVILATGAQERPFPIMGWTLPGVMMAGAAQILLKTSGAVPADRTVLAGCGPLLYLLAWQYLNAGVKVEALLDTTPAGALRRGLPHALEFIRSPYLAKGIQLLRAVKAAIPVIKGVRALEALGDRHVASVRYSTGSATASLAVDRLLLHHGVIPNINLSRAMGVEHQWNELQACWEPIVDDWGATQVEQVSIAGDGAGIAGALAAEHRGRIAALNAAHRLNRIDLAQRDREAARYRIALQRALRGRAFLDRFYIPSPQFRIPKGETIVCRCEEVTAAQVREAVKLGCQGPNQLKSFLRCGMGPCQGRYCGVTVTEIMADEWGVSPARIGYYRLRFPTKPLTLRELASLPQTEASRQAVVRLKK